MNQPEELDFVHTFVPGRSTRTLLLLHGTGGNENDLIPLGRDLDPDANLLSPRGKVLENGMPRFFRRLAEGIFDEEAQGDYKAAKVPDLDYDVGGVDLFDAAPLALNDDDIVDADGLGDSNLQTGEEI